MLPTSPSGLPPRKRRSYTVRCSHCGYRNPPQRLQCSACRQPLVADWLAHFLGWRLSLVPTLGLAALGALLCLAAVALPLGGLLRPRPTAVAVASPTRTAPPPPSATARPTATATARSTSAPHPSATPSPTVTPVPQAIVQVDGLNVREGPGTMYDVLTTIPAANTTLAVVGQAQGLPWIKVTLADSSEGWISALPEHAQLTVNKDSLPVALFRPLSGPVQTSPDMTGLGELSLENRGANDYAVILALEQTVYAATYMRQGENYTLTGIPDGAYDVYACSGADWNGLRFQRSARCQKMAQPLKFTTDSATYPTWTLTLQPVLGANTTATDVTAAEVPPLQPDTTASEP